MMRRRSHRLIMTVASSIAVLVACGSDSKPTVTTSATEIANPASEFCVKQGGKVEIVDAASGQVGYCNLPDGTRVEEWAYFRSQTGTTTAP